MPAPVPIPSPPSYDPTRDAEKYRSLVWEHINKRLQALLGNHHYNHEPGGKDELVLPLGGLADVALGTAVSNGDVLTYNAAGTCWTNGAGGGGGGGTAGQAFFEAVGSITPGIIPGPTNMYGTALQITRVLFASNGTVSGSETLTGQTFSFTGVGTDDNTGLAVTWADGAQLMLSIDAASGSALYLTADVLFRLGTA